MGIEVVQCVIESCLDPPQHECEACQEPVCLAHVNFLMGQAYSELHELKGNWSLGQAHRFCDNCLRMALISKPLGGAVYPGGLP